MEFPDKKIEINIEFFVKNRIEIGKKPEWSHHYMDQLTWLQEMMWR